MRRRCYFWLIIKRKYLLFLLVGPLDGFNHFIEFGLFLLETLLGSDFLFLQKNHPVGHGSLLLFGFSSFFFLLLELVPNSNEIFIESGEVDGLVIGMVRLVLLYRVELD